MYIGKKVRDLRRRQQMALIELSEKSGVQLATLSRIEHEKMVGTLQSHIQIAKALGVEVTELYSDISPETSTVSIKEKNSAAEVFVDSKKSSYEILTHQVSTKKMMPTMLKIEPGGRTSQDQQVAGAEKFLFVLDGKIEATISGKTYPLSKGHTLYFRSSLPHFYANAGKSTARVLCVATPVTL